LDENAAMSLLAAKREAGPSQRIKRRPKKTTAKKGKAPAKAKSR
jgi:hypothetical protein